jgi:hypothetical protein
LKIHVLYTNNMCYIQIFFVLFVTYKTIFPWIVIILLWYVTMFFAPPPFVVYTIC